MPCTISTSETFYYSIERLKCLYLIVIYIRIACVGPMSIPYQNQHSAHTPSNKSSGLLATESLKDMFSKEEYRKYAISPYIGKSWSKLTTNVFVAFLFWVIFLLHHFFV